MSRPTACLTLAVLLAAAPPALGQEKFDLKIKKPAPGETDLVEKTEVETNTSYVVDKAGKKLQDLEAVKKETRLAYRETIVEKPADAPRPTKLKRQYDKAQVTTDGKTAKLPYQGKTVLIEKKEDIYRFFVEGGAELKDQDAALLAREFNKKSSAAFDKLLLPGRPVAVGETWGLDTAAILREWKTTDGPVVDEAKVQGSGKLVKVYQKDGRQFGVLKIELTMPLKAFPAAKGVELSPLSKLVLSTDLDVCIDGTAALGTVVGRVGLDIRGKFMGQPTGIVALTRSTLTEVHKEAGPR